MHLSALNTAALAGLFARAGVVALECVAGGSLVRPPKDVLLQFDWPSLLSAAPMVTRLVLRHFPADPLFQALGGCVDAHPPAGREAAPPVPCSALEDLTCEWEYEKSASEDEPLGSASTLRMEILRDTVDTISRCLARRAELGARNLGRLVLEENGVPNQLRISGVTEMTLKLDEILAPLRRLVDGPVDYRETGDTTSTNFVGFSFGGLFGS